MADNDKTITTFTTRVRQMILRFEEIKKENGELYAMLDKQEKEIKQLSQRLEQSNRDMESLRMAKMMEISNGDIDSAKRRIASLIRDVNKCITLMSEKQ